LNEAAEVAADAGPMGIEWVRGSLREGIQLSTWEGGEVVGETNFIAVIDWEKPEEQICSAARHRETERAKTRKVSCCRKSFHAAAVSRPSGRVNAGSAVRNLPLQKCNGLWVFSAL